MTDGNGEKITNAKFQGMMIERTGDILRRLEELEKKVGCNIVDLATLKVKAGLWGFLAGSVPALVTAFAQLLR